VGATCFIAATAFNDEHRERGHRGSLFELDGAGSDPRGNILDGA